MADSKISNLTAATTPLAGTEVLPIVQSGATKKVAISDLTTGRAVSATQYTSTITTGTAPLVVASTTEVANLRSATSTAADSATSSNAVKSNATTGILQVAGPAAASTRVMTTPDANFTAARTDAAQSFTGNQTLSTGNLVIGTAGSGIDFSASSHAGGMTSELLSDYEEGTWTPSDVSGAGLAFTSALGRYTKVGNQVTAWAWVQYPATASGLDNTIGGLPFSIANQTALRGGFALGFSQTASAAGGILSPNQAYFVLVTSTGVNTTNVALSTNIVSFAVIYHVA